MNRTTLSIAIVIGGSLAACTLAPGASPTAAPTATLPPAATATERPPPTVTPTFTPTDTPTATPFLPFEIAIASTDAANLRAGPGYLFLILKILPPGTKVQLLGRAPGSEWFLVQTANNLEGWVFGKLLRRDEELLHAPIVEPSDAGVIRGRVLDSAGTPMLGIGFTVSRRAAPAEPGNPVVTDANGEFYSFQPYKGGVWTVTFTGVACESNAWLDAGCTYYKEGYRGAVEPLARDVRLPQEGILEFTWM
ncbi:MAG: SH3 domain-containing protein [Anaerolineales bacterium]|nr:SH3 domain-containing protein [Anaerolineales bacterium]